jgi:hypothetical protein
VSPSKVEAAPVASSRKVERKHEGGGAPGTKPTAQLVKSDPDSVYEIMMKIGITETVLGTLGTIGTFLGSLQSEAIRTEIAEPYVRASTAPWLKKLGRWHRREPGEDGVGPWSDRYEEFVACWERWEGFSACDRGRDCERCLLSGHGRVPACAKR